MPSLEKFEFDERVSVRGGEDVDPDGRCIVYRMRRAQRALANPALECAISAANALGLPVVVFFGLLERHQLANLRHYHFMLEGLIGTARRLEERGIGFVMRLCEASNSNAAFAKFCVETRPALIIADEDPARRAAAWKREASIYPRAPLWSVDADVIVPSTLLGREHFAARTIRPRIRERLDEFLRPVRNQAVRVKWNPRRKPDSLAPSLQLTARLHIDISVQPVNCFHGGTTEALATLRRFVHERLRNYKDRRNLPELDATSQLSPYLHFGQIGPHTVALAARDADAPALSREAFIEEMIVRRELAVNFVRFNPSFRSLASSEPWALRTIAQHARDSRPHRYNECQLENAETHDPLWNAAQRQMVRAGWMHGYLRMYWAKKILEWSESAAAAYEIAMRLNDRYELDGRDPNGYAGIAWAIGGKHDRAWGPERSIYGKIRYMSLASTSRKFDSRAYISRWSD
jgi:deoxyribodipyrimidine photo-lyase